MIRINMIDNKLIIIEIKNNNKNYNKNNYYNNNKYDKNKYDR